MAKIKIKEALVVEGRYDKNTLAQLVDAPIFVTDGFGIFKDPERLSLLRAVAEKRGLIVLTDPDGGGLVIRNHLKGAIDSALVKHAYIPEVYGKEPRKAAPGKEGKLGVEGMEPEVLITALRNAGATFLDEATGTSANSAESPVGSRCVSRTAMPGATSHAFGRLGQQATEDGGRGSFDFGSASAQDDIAVGAAITSPACRGGGPASRPVEGGLPSPAAAPITKTDLYELGLSGRPDSKEKRRELQKKLGLPENLSSNALLTALNCIMTRDEFYAL